MKKTVNVAIGGCSFIIDEDACNVLSEYLDRFKAALEDITTSEGIMEELEGRIADQLKEKLGAREVVDVKMVNEVTGNWYDKAGGIAANYNYRTPCVEVPVFAKNPVAEA